MKNDWGEFLCVTETLSKDDSVLGLFRPCWTLLGLVLASNWGLIRNEDRSLLHRCNLMSLICIDV